MKQAARLSMRLAAIFLASSLTAHAAGTIFSAYPSATAATGPDLLLLDQYSGGLYSTKKIAAQDLFQNTIFRLNGIAGGTAPRILLTNYYTPALLWLRCDNWQDRSAIWFGNGDLASGFNGANFLWNPTHDDPAGQFGGEIQITAPQMAIGFGGDSYYGGMRVGRRLQIGIGSGHLQWVDFHYDDDGTAGTPYPGWAVPLRFQVQQQGTAHFPTLYAFQEDTGAGVGHSTLGFYDDFNTGWTDAGGHNVFSGATQGGTGTLGQHPTIRGAMRTGRGWDFYGTVGLTNVINANGASPDMLWKYESPFLYFGKAAGANNPIFTLGLNTSQGSFGFARASDGKNILNGIAGAGNGTLEIGNGLDTDLVFETGGGIGGTRRGVIGPNGNYIQPSLAINASGNTQPSHGVLDVNGGDIWTSGFIVSGGATYNTADQNITSAALANMANLSKTVTLTAGQAYKFTMTIFYQETTTADGMQVDLGGGTATATDTRWHIVIHDNGGSLKGSTQNSGGLSAVVQNTVAVGTSLLQIEGVITPSGSGTVIPRFAQVAHSTGTLSIFHGSTLTFTKL